MSRAVERQINFADWELMRQGLRLEPVLQAISDFIDDQQNIIQHKADNSYSAAAFMKARTAINNGKGVVPITEEVYAVSLPEAAQTLLEIAAIEMRETRSRKLHFCLIPCGSRVFGELPEEAARALVGIGLSYSETPFPVPPRPD